MVGLGIARGAVHGVVAFRTRANRSSVLATFTHGAFFSQCDLGSDMAGGLFVLVRVGITHSTVHRVAFQARKSGSSFFASLTHLGRLRKKQATEVFVRSFRWRCSATRIFFNTKRQAQRVRITSKQNLSSTLELFSEALDMSGPGEEVLLHKTPAQLQDLVRLRIREGGCETNASTCY